MNVPHALCPNPIRLKPAEEDPFLSVGWVRGINSRSSVPGHSTKALRTIAMMLLSIHLVSCEKKGSHDFVIVSDVDDTVKVTHVLYPPDAVRNAVASNVGFAGMPQLYRELLGPNSSPERLEFVSGSPRLILSHKVKEFLEEASFPAYKLTLRDRVRSAYQYKERLLQAMYKDSQGKFILIGDDTECDPLVYRDFALSKPNQVLAIYIHRITGDSLPEGSIPFVTAYDIALQEYRAGRLSEEQVAVVGAAVLSSQGSAFLPKFQVCPKEDKNQDLPAFLGELENKISNKIVNACAGGRPTRGLQQTETAKCAVPSLRP
jgi:hypothetical protein